MIEIRAMTPADWPEVEAIFAEGIATGSSTFETKPPTYDAFEATHHGDHTLVAVEHGRVVGWAALAPTSSRPCYSGVAEGSVYVAQAARSRGIGLTLMEAVIAGARTGGVWTIQAAMFPENAASVALHERLGFRRVGHFERIALLDGVWRDTVLYELRL